MKNRIGVSFKWALSGAVCLFLTAAILFAGDSRCEQADDASGNVGDTASKRVIFTTHCDGDVTHFYLENRELSEITMTFDFKLTNLKSTRPLPFTETFEPNQRIEVFSVSPIDPDAGWKYSFLNYHILGGTETVHDDSYVYSLPYAPGSAFRVTQGYSGKFSHHGSNRYSIDWQMPEGTPVYAARGGLVVKVKDDSNIGGPDPKFDTMHNFVLICHSDGTLGQYAHLKKGGAKVREGDIVSVGDLIALSGNTGFSSGPHLHFSVYKARDGKERESIPVRFRTSTEFATTLKPGKTYTAISVEPAATQITHVSRVDTSNGD